VEQHPGVPYWHARIGVKRGRWAETRGRRAFHALARSLLFKTSATWALLSTIDGEIMKATILGACALVLAGGLAFAQGQQPATPPEPQQQQPTPPPPQQQQQQPTMPGQQQTVSVSDSDIQKFAEIYVEVEETRNELTLEMNEASSQEEAQEIQTRMQQEIVAAIADHGWSVDRYNDVATAISNDPELRTQALDLINELSST
jgi:hypothetical protein